MKPHTTPRTPAAAALIWLDQRIITPVVRLASRLGVAPRAFALVETTGRHSGQPRHTPVGNGLIGDTFWLIAARGDAADYVKNLQANPHVRVKIGHKWRSGRAVVLPEADTGRQLEQILAHHGWLRRLDAHALAASIRLRNSVPRLVRIDLTPTPPTSPGQHRSPPYSEIPPGRPSQP